MAAPQPIPRVTGWKKWRGCKNKVLRFRNRDEAEAHRVKLYYGGELRSYHCGFCGNWHLGHPRTTVTGQFDAGPTAQNVPRKGTNNGTTA